MAVCSSGLLVFSVSCGAYQYMEVGPPPVVTVAPQDGNLQAIVLARQGVPKMTLGCGAAKDSIRAIGASCKAPVCEQICARLLAPGLANHLTHG